MIHSTAESQVWVDDRYRGAHGIGRYSTEVLARLSVAWMPMGLSGSPSGPTDTFRRLSSDIRRGPIYSPGYGAFSFAGPQILTIHDLIHLEVPWPARAKYLAYYNGPLRRVVRRNRVVLTVSETSQRAIQKWLDDDRVDVVNAGIGCSSEFVAEGAAFQADAPYALFVGNTREHKKLSVLLDAMVLIPELELRIVAPLSEVAEIRRWTVSRGVQDRVLVSSGVDDATLATLYRGAFVTALPSALEGFGLPALESVKCGTPVVYWAGCESVREIVGVNGVAVEELNDAKAWATALSVAQASPISIRPPDADAYSWTRTAESVSAVLGRHLVAGM